MGSARASAQNCNYEPPFDASKLSPEQRAMLRQMLELRLALTGQAVPPQLEATGADYVLDNDD